MQISNQQLYQMKVPISIPKSQSKEPDLFATPKNINLQIQKYVDSSIQTSKYSTLEKIPPAK